MGTSRLLTERINRSPNLLSPPGSTKILTFAMPPGRLSKIQDPPINRAAIDVVGYSREMLCPLDLIFLGCVSNTPS
ncbi:hypothetical protein CDAR_417481 [Caerostris darwini]|uniref:Uncharacterized protein n=1 Tax=Caerostris darwini TaxID=1538125 RepID=A0AAV4VSQ6_9ARAC|nr:hypothetical protein CDAR_417481 [Caerostris darwini]